MIGVLSYFVFVLSYFDLSLSFFEKIKIGSYCNTLVQNMPNLQTFAIICSIKPNLLKFANYLFARSNLQNFAKQMSSLQKFMQTIGRVRSGRAILNLAMWVMFLTISLRLLNSIEKCLNYAL